jgi:AcrR family transcriptional regulator
MGRRSEHSLEQIKAMALDAAERIVTEQGLDALSTRNIAKAMGYTSGTLYLVFKNLDDLVLQLNQRTIQGMARAVQGAVQPGAKAEQNVRAICKAYLQFGREHRPHWELLFQRRWPEGFVYPAWYSAEMGKSLVPFEQELSRLLGPKGSPHQVTLAGRAIWSAMQGIHGLYASGRMERLGVGNIEELIDFQIDLLIKGLEFKKGKGAPSDA